VDIYHKMRRELRTKKNPYTPEGIRV